MFQLIGECLVDGIRPILSNLQPEKANHGEDLYRKGLAAMNGEKRERNTREAFQLFKKASEVGHAGATSELAECYRSGRGCEKDTLKAADLGSPKAALEIALKRESERNQIEYMRYLWVASDGGESEATKRLVELYKNGTVVEKDLEESRRLLGNLEAQFQPTGDGLEWKISHREKTLFIKGNEK